MGAGLGVGMGVGAVRGASVGVVASAPRNSCSPLGGVIVARGQRIVVLSVCQRCV